MISINSRVTKNAIYSSSTQLRTAEPVQYSYVISSGKDCRKPHLTTILHRSAKGKFIQTTPVHGLRSIPKPTTNISCHSLFKLYMIFWDLGVKDTKSLEGWICYLDSKFRISFHSESDNTLLFRDCHNSEILRADFLQG
jgi:hypothetical protein